MRVTDHRTRTRWLLLPPPTLHPRGEGEGGRATVRVLSALAKPGAVSVRQAAEGAGSVWRCAGES